MHNSKTSLAFFFFLFFFTDYTDEDQIFITGDPVNAEYITTRQSEAMTTGSCDQEESCVTDAQNSDGEMYYAVFSDDESSESQEGDYETDLEVDEESKWTCRLAPVSSD